MTIIILGGGYAGLLAAKGLADAGHGDDTVLIDRNAAFVEPIRRHQIAAGQDVPAHDYHTVLNGMGVEFVQAEIAELDPDRQSVTLETPAGNREKESYRLLIYALGSGTDPALLPGANAHAHRLDSAGNAQRFADTVRRAAAAKGRVLIIGAGLTGIETAAELGESTAALDISLLHDRRLESDFSPAGASHIRRTLTGLGVDLREETSVARLTADEAHLAPHPSKGRAAESIGFAACLWAGGVRAPALARTGGLAVDALGRILVDSAGRSVSHPDILAIGDAAAQTDAEGRPLRPACATAMPQGRHAAEAVTAVLAGRAPPDFSFSYRMRCISLGREDGLIQFVSAADRPLDRVWTGEKAAAMKEWVCRSTLASLGLIGEDSLGPMPFALPDGAGAR